MKAGGIWSHLLSTSAPGFSNWTHAQTDMLTFVVVPSFGGLDVVLPRLLWCVELCVCPSLLVCSLSSDPNPVKGVLGPVALRKGFTVLVSEGLIKTGYLSYGFDIYHPGDKKLILSPQKASWCPIKQTKEGTFNVEGKHVLSRGQGHHCRKYNRTSRSNKLNLQLTFICFIWKKRLSHVLIFALILWSCCKLVPSFRIPFRCGRGSELTLPESWHTRIWNSMKLISAVGMKEHRHSASARSSSLKARLSWKHMVVNWAHLCTTLNIRSNKENTITCHLCKQFSDLRLHSKTKILAVLFCPPSFVPSVWWCHVWFRMCCC